MKYLLLSLVLLSCRSGDEPTVPVEGSLDPIILEVCRQSCGEAEFDSVLGLTFETGVKINVDTIAPGACLRLDVEALWQRELSSDDTITIGYFKEDRRFWGPPRLHQITLLSVPLSRRSVSLGCR